MHAIEHTYVSLLADVSYLTGFSEIRGSYEGLHWCLNEAPKLEKLILKSVESGDELDLEMFPEWLHRLALGSLVDPILMRYVRQLLLFCYKAYVTHDDKTTEESFSTFFRTNQEVGEFTGSLAKASPLLLNLARRHCQSVLYRFREKEIIPSHGPGAVTTSKEKWQHRYSTIEYLYPYNDWYNLYFNRDHAAQIEDTDYEQHIEAKLIAVPKDSRGPRLICVHPAEAIWLQQGLRRELERVISLNRRSEGPWPKGHVNFDNQTVNGNLALISSRGREFATIDMKEASDRISDALVQILFGDKYKWFGCCRAQVFRAKVGRKSFKGQLHCYAPMGNATTFPVQSLVFWAICVASMQYHGFHQPGAVYVFGDDIIMPTRATEAVINDLESFGLRVNRSKSFWRGAFRESCGVDAFNGFNVTPVRWKTSFDAEQLTGLQSLSDIAQRLRCAGFQEASVTAYSILRKRMRQLHCDVSCTNNPNHGGIAEYVSRDSEAFRDAYWHRDSQWFVSPVWRLETKAHRGNGSDWNHVLESVCSLERTARSHVPDRTVSRRLRLNRGWMPVL